MVTHGKPQVLSRLTIVHCSQISVVPLGPVLQGKLRVGKKRAMKSGDWNILIEIMRKVINPNYG
jgi:hypothetical protein